MAHWFGVKPWELDDLTVGEIEVFVRALAKLPPVGGVVMMEPKK